MTNYGLQIVEPTSEDYMFGGVAQLGGEVLVPDGQWDEWVPQDETQNLATEPLACVSFATLNCIEILERQEYGKTDNWSDRFLAYISGTNQNGNNPNTVSETLRKKGVVPEEYWAYTQEDNTWDKFYASPPSNLYTKALEFIAEYSYGHEWVNTDQQSMIDALMYSPLGVAGFAWAQDTDGFYITPEGTQPCHYFVVYGYDRNNYWKVFDSYTNTHKKLRWDYKFSMIKKYTLHRQVVNESAWQKFLSLMKQILGI